MAEGLNKEGLTHLWGGIKQKLNEKQDELTGTPGQIVGVNDAGEAQVLTLQAGENVSIEQKDGVITISIIRAEVPAHIYGVEWDGTSTTKLSRTDAAAEFTDPVPYVAGMAAEQCGSPFDKLQPWAGMVKVEDAEAGTLVAIPKFWYKWTQNGSTLKLQIADYPAEGFYVSPAHADRGDGKGERDIVYVGRYHCHTSNYKSQTGGLPKAEITRSVARTAIHNLGATIWQSDLAMHLTIQMLYLVEFADWDSQSKIGFGCSNKNEVQNMGYTDSMPYHTGTTQASRTAYGLGTQYRYIEGLWDDIHDWMDGCYYSSSGMSVIMNPSSFSERENGTVVGMPITDWIAAFNVAEAGGLQWIIPSSTSGGGESVYVPDYWNFDASYPCLFCGGYYKQTLKHGLFYVSCGTAGGLSVAIGCRLQKLPDPEEAASA